MSELSTGGLINALSLSLLHFLWQGALIGAMTALALRALKNARPQTRYAVACAALLSCLLVAASTVLGALMPTAVVGLTPMGGEATSLAYPAPTGSDVVLPTDAPLPQWLAPWLAPWLVTCWAAGSGVMFLRMALGLAAIRRLRQFPAAPAEWQRRLDLLAARFGLRPVALLITPGLSSPISAGCLRPIVLLPAALLTRMPVAYIEALLAHELAHIRRHDYLINLMQVVVETLLFYHPAVWWLAGQIRLEREQIADQLAAGVIGTPRPLALALAELADLTQSPAAEIALAQAADGGTLKVRIKQLFAAKSVPAKPAWRFAVVLLSALGLSLSTLGLFACAQLAHDANDAHPTMRLPGQTTKKADRLSFALVRGGNKAILAWGPDDEIDQVARTLKPKHEDFVLVRRNGRDSLVMDAAVVKPLRHAWEHAEMLEIQIAQHDAVLQRLAGQLDTMDVNDHAIPALKGTYRKNMKQVNQLQREEALVYQQVERLLHEQIARSPGLAL